MHPSWSFQHTEPCAVPPDFAWRYWTNVANWAIDSDIESVTLHGPFAAGSAGITRSRRSGEIHWTIASAHPGEAVIETPAPGAIARFRWRFEPAAPGAAGITQLVQISGPGAAPLIAAFAPDLERGIPAGMKKLCEAMEHALKASAA